MSQVDTARLTEWLFNAALPIWKERGGDQANGGVKEELALDGSLSDPGFKRVRVPARQIYVFSHASLMGWEPGLAQARTHYENFVETARHSVSGAWVKRLNSDNSVLDDTIDLYDNAFALFALSWYFRASGDVAVKGLMLETARFIDQELRHPNLGFWHQLPNIGPRIQNPHMHLLEACLACLDAFYDPLFERLAREVIGLFEAHFFNSTTQTLGEYFDDDFNLLPGELGQIAEPGHQMEWAWILAKAQNLFSIDMGSQARALVTFAERYGVNKSGKMAGTTFNSVRVDGTTLDAGSRTWPNTERLKAAVAMFELFGEDPRPIINETLDALFRLHLAHPICGLWYDAFDTQGRVTASAIPTSTFYHLYLAFAEVIRIAPALEKRFGKS